MTPQEAIEIITNAVQGDGTKVTAEQDEALAIVKRVMKKQKPKRTDKTYLSEVLGYANYCPSCGNPVHHPIISRTGKVYHNNRYCRCCGQALEWSDS